MAGPAGAQRAVAAWRTRIESYYRHLFFFASLSRSAPPTHSQLTIHEHRKQISTAW